MMLALFVTLMTIATIDNVDAVFKTLRMLVENLFKRFKDNQMKGRTDKCH